MDPLRFAIATVPLGAYLVMIGLANLRRRPMLVTGAGDLAALGTALTGVALIGPISLFRPEGATVQLGDTVWLFLLAFYWLWLALAVMLCRPRLVVYNATSGEVRAALADTVAKLDPGARWAGDSLFLPGIGVRLHLDNLPWMRNTSLVSSGGNQDLAGWRRLARGLHRTLRSIDSPPNPRAGVMVGSGGTLITLAVWRMVNEAPAVAIAWKEVFAFG